MGRDAGRAREARRGFGAVDAFPADFDFDFDFGFAFAAAFFGSDFARGFAARRAGFFIRR